MSKDSFSSFNSDPSRFGDKTLNSNFGDDSKFNGERLPFQQLDLAPSPEGEFGIFSYASGTDKGLGRENNEDTVTTRVIKVGQEEYLVMVVADGMGGHGNGEKASLKAATLIPSHLEANLNKSVGIAQALANAVVAADGDIRTTIPHEEGKAAPGTTVTVAIIDRLGHAIVASFGDSRAYVVKGDKAKPATEDDSVVANLVRLGLIHPQDIYNHPKRNLITKSLGASPKPLNEEDVRAKMIEFDIKPGESLLLATDGLWEMVRDPQIGGIIGSSSPENAVRSLIEAANNNGGVDNITAAIARNDIPNAITQRRDGTTEPSHKALNINDLLSLIFMQAGRNPARIPETLRQVLAQYRPDILEQILNAQPGRIPTQVENFGVPKSLVAKLGNWPNGFERLTQYSPLGIWKDLVVSIGLGMFSNATGRNVEWQEVESALSCFRETLVRSFDLRSNAPLQTTLSSAAGTVISQQPLNISVNGGHYTFANQEEIFVAALGAEYIFDNSQISGVSLVIPTGQGDEGLEIKLSQEQYLQLMRNILNNSTSGRRKAILGKYLTDFNTQTRGLAGSMSPDEFGRTKSNKRAVNSTWKLLGDQGY